MKIRLILMLLVCVSSIKAQQLEWANSLNGNLNGSGHIGFGHLDNIQPKHAIDELGNSYLAGTFKDSTYFQNQLFTTKGGEDVFIQKYNSIGNVLWTILLGKSRIKAFSVNKAGEILITGTFKDSLKLYQNSLEYGLADDTLGVNYILRLETDGKLKWIKQFSSTIFDQAALGDNGDIILSGPSGISGFYISKFDSVGNFKWRKEIFNRSEPRNTITSIHLDPSGNSFFTGYFGYRMDFDPGPGVFELGPSGPVPYKRNCFVLKLDKQGDFSWAKPIAMQQPNWNSSHIYTFGEASGYTIDLDNQGSIYISGSFKDSVDFDPGIGTYFFPPKGISSFILKLDSLGNFNWVYSPKNSVEIVSMGVSLSGSVYSTGRYSGAVDFDPSASIHNLKSNGLKDIFIQKLDTDGKLEWVRSLDGKGSDVGLSIKANYLEEVFISGQYTDTIDLDPSQSINNFYPIDSIGRNFFSLKLNNCNPDSSVDKIKSCSSYKWIDGNVYDSSNNTSLVRLMNSSGCDSIVSLALTIHSIDITTSLTDSSILSNDTLSSYRWLDCSTGYQLIQDELDREFVYSDTGRYAVELSIEDCVDTSNCILISTTSTSEHSSLDRISLYPNPTNHFVNIETDRPFSKGVIIVRDISGRMIDKIEFNTQNIPQLDLLGNKGLYFIELFLDFKKTRSFKVVKQ